MTDKRDSSRPASLTQGPLFRAVCVLSVVGTTCAVGYALESHAHFTVGARVLPVTTVRVRSAPTELAISAQDVGRGYVEVVEPTRLEVSNNSPQGYVLLILPRTRMFSSLTVHGMGGEVTLGTDGGAIVARRQTGSTIPLELTFRFDLVPSLAAGSYPWPVQLAVQPLDPAP